MAEPLTIALPSKGILAEPTLAFMRDCGLAVHKPNPRQYTGSIPGLPGVSVLFQRVRDVVYKVADGTAQLGITGLDNMHELAPDGALVVHEALGYGHCRLLVAVPSTWLDVQNMADLADVALGLRQRQRPSLRVATNFNRLARQFFYAHELHHFSLVRAEGAIEAAPTLGYADCVVDLSQTGTTLRENHLKPLEDGTVLGTQASLVRNRRWLRNHAATHKGLRQLLERIDAARQGREYVQLTANIARDDPARIARDVMRSPATRGLQGPTLAPVYDEHGQQGFALTLIVAADQLLPAIDHLRSIGGRQASARPLRYVFLGSSPTRARLLRALELPDSS